MTGRQVDKEAGRQAAWYAHRAGRLGNWAFPPRCRRGIKGWFTCSPLALAPLGWLIFDALTGHLTANPIQAIEQRTGRYAFYLLVASLACTPVNIVTGWRPVLRWRRPLGLYAFLYAALHFLAFIGLDYGFNLAFVWADVGNKRYILVGAAAWLILAGLALTSTAGWQRRLGQAWRRLHRGVYVAGGLVVVHYAWSLKKEIGLPLAWGAILIALLALRLPSIRRWFAGRRQSSAAARPNQLST